MRTIPILLTAALLLGPLAVAAPADPGVFHFHGATIERAPGTQVGGVDMNDRRIVTFTVTNIGGVAGPGGVTVEVWTAADTFPGSIKRQDIWLEADETATYVLDVTIPLITDGGRTWINHGPVWICAAIWDFNVNTGDQEYCEFDWVGTPFPEGVLPKDMRRL